MKTSMKALVLALVSVLSSSAFAGGKIDLTKCRLLVTENTTDKFGGRSGSREEFETETVNGEASEDVSEVEFRANRYDARAYIHALSPIDTAVIVIGINQNLADQGGSSNHYVPLATIRNNGEVPMGALTIGKIKAEVICDIKPNVK